VKRGNALFDSALGLMLRNDSEYLFKCHQDNGFLPKLSVAFYAHLYESEHLSRYISPNFHVPPYVIANHLPTKKRRKQTQEHRYNGVQPRAITKMRYAEWIIRRQFNTFYGGEPISNYNMVKDAILWCLRQKANLMDSSGLIKVFLETDVPSIWTLEIGMLILQGCTLSEDYEFKTVIAQRMYKRSEKSARKQFRDAARARSSFKAL